MTAKTPQHAYLGTPDQWWEQAEPILESEAAERHLGSWYIMRETNRGEPTGSFRVAVPTMQNNASRLDELNRLVHRGEKHRDDLAENVRALIRVPQERPEWMDADLIIADSEVGSSERVAWRHAKGQWRQVFDPKKSAGERRMVDLNPVVADITPKEV